MNARDQLLVKHMGKLFESAQEDFGLTNKEVADHMKISQQFYGKIVKGEVHLPVPKIKKLITFLGISKAEYKKCLNAFVDAEVNRVFK